MDPMQRRLEQMRACSDSARRRAGLYRDIAGIEDQRTAKSLGAVQRASAPGSKLQKIGFIMLWIPEPTMITAGIGGPMILAGRYLDKKYNGATISDIGVQTSKTVSDIQSIKNML